MPETAIVSISISSGANHTPAACSLKQVIFTNIFKKQVCQACLASKNNQ
jgi:hypothetical protein